jgi:hypothetical protein
MVDIEPILSAIPILPDYYRLLSSALGTSLINLIYYTIGMVLFTVFIWHFYRFVSKRDVFPLNLGDQVGGKKVAKAFGYVLEYLVIFPIFVFLWFGIFSIFLLFIAKSVPVDQIFLISMSLVATIRITSYYNEDLSKDISKLIPFALLAIFLVSPDFFSLDLVVARSERFVTFAYDILKFSLFVVGIEWLLRIAHLIKMAIKKV